MICDGRRLDDGMALGRDELNDTQSRGCATTTEHESGARDERTDSTEMKISEVPV